MRKVEEVGAKPYLSEFSPIPGTVLWEAATKASPYPIEEEPLFQNPSLSPCAPEGFTIERPHWKRPILGGTNQTNLGLRSSCPMREVVRSNSTGRNSLAAPSREVR